MVNKPESPSEYRGRLAPSPTGHLHLGHAQTFWTAQERAQQNNGTLILRNEDLDRARCKPEFVQSMFEDLAWFGFRWSEGPDCGGPHAPYAQSERSGLYLAALEQLLRAGHLYPCACSRRDIQRAASAPHGPDDELIYPGTCRPAFDFRRGSFVMPDKPSDPCNAPGSGALVSWRFKVPHGEIVSFVDGNSGQQQFEAGVDFGDFVVWRPDDICAYQLAVVVDDAAMEITEVVRGADLLISTARQLLLYRALGLNPPSFFHCPLMRDQNGQRLAKRNDSLSLRTLRSQGKSPESLRAAGHHFD